VETVETDTVPMVKAVATDDLEAVTALLATGADANVKNSVAISVLVLAIWNESAPIVEALLKNRADPNVRDVDTDRTPLLETGDRQIIKLLLAAGADVNSVSRKQRDLLIGMTPLMLAAIE
jgi:ankyrin repeat protein